MVESKHTHILVLWGWLSMLLPMLQQVAEPATVCAAWLFCIMHGHVSWLYACHNGCVLVKAMLLFESLFKK